MVRVGIILQGAGCMANLEMQLDACLHGGHVRAKSIAHIPYILQKNKYVAAEGKFRGRLINRVESDYCD